MSSLIRDLQRAFVLTLAVAASSTLSAATERNDSSVFRAKAVAIEYPPFLSPDLPGFGRSFVVLQQLLQQHCCWQFDPVFLPPPRLLKYTRHNDDWLFSFMPVPAGRTDVMSMSLQSGYIKSGFFRLRKDSPFIWQDLERFSGKRVVLMRALTESNTEKRLVSAGMTVMTVNHVRQGLHMLATGRADFVQALEETGYYFAAEEGLDAEALQFTDPPAAVYPLTLYINRRHPLAESFIRALQAGLQDTP